MTKTLLLILAVAISGPVFADNDFIYVEGDDAKALIEVIQKSNEYYKLKRDRGEFMQRGQMTRSLTNNSKIMDTPVETMINKQMIQSNDDYEIATIKIKNGEKGLKLDRTDLVLCALNTCVFQPGLDASNMRILFQELNKGIEHGVGYSALSNTSDPYPTKSGSLFEIGTMQFCETEMSYKDEIVTTYDFTVMGDEPCMGLNSPRVNKKSSFPQNLPPSKSKK